MKIAKLLVLSVLWLTASSAFAAVPENVHIPYLSILYVISLISPLAAAVGGGNKFAVFSLRPKR